MSANPLDLIEARALAGTGPRTPQDIRTTVKALRAVEAVHQPGCGCPGCDCGGEEGRPAICGSCNEYYPCPTVTAIRAGLSA